MAVSWREARDQLRTMREEQSNDSQKILELAEPLLESSASSLGNGVYAIYEQACVAALDCSRDDLAKSYHQKLEARFGKESGRIGLLKAQILEAAEKWDEATKLYEHLLKENPTNGNIPKRQIAGLIARGENSEAIVQLNKYLESFMCDHEAWMELGLLYLKDNRFTDALFCFEELILSNPYNHVFHQRYAEICYTIGDSEHMDLARKHFSQALKLNDKSARAMFGLLLVTKREDLKSKSKNSSNSFSDNKPLSTVCETALSSLHQKSPAKPLVEGMIALMLK